MDTQEYKLKTKYCTSVLENKPCFYGKNCRFAHNTSELRVNSCFFGAGCCHVWWNNGKYAIMVMVQFVVLSIRGRIRSRTVIGLIFPILKKKKIKVWEKDIYK